MRAQTAPIFGMQAGDYTGNGHLDVLLVGNWYALDAETGRADAFVGAVLRGDGTGTFDSLDYTDSGFFVPGDAKGLAEVASGERPSLVVATQNNDSLRAFAPTERRGRSVRLHPLDRFVTLTFKDGSTRKKELHYGSGYLSQSSRTVWVPRSAERVVVHGADGSSRPLPSTKMPTPVQEQ